MLSIESTKKICVLGARLVNLLREVVEVVGPVMQHLGDDEGAFPRRGEFVWSLLIHPEHKIPLLKCSTVDVPSVESMKVLLINSRPYQVHLSFFFQKVNSILPRLLRLSF